LSYKDRSGGGYCAPIFLFLAGLAILPVAGCLFARPCALDESVLVFENPLVTGELPWWKALTGFHYFQYTPIAFLSNRLNADLFGLDAVWSFRLVSWLIHAASGCVLWCLLGQLGLGRRGRLFVACAWVVHPMACETVAWIAERSNALAFFFGALALWAYTTWHGRWQGVVWSSLAFAAALLSKPLALGWLPVFVVLEVLGGPNRLRGESVPTVLPERAQGLRWGPAALRILPLVVLAMALMLVGLNSYETADRPPPGGTWFTALLTDTSLFLRYVRNTLVPTHLSAMYAIRDIVSLADKQLWLNVMAWLVLLCGSVALAESRRRAIFGWLWFFGGLGPACNVVAIGYPMQDRYVYLSSAGLLLVVAEVAAGLAERMHLARAPDVQTPLPATDVSVTAVIPASDAPLTPTTWARGAYVGPILGALCVAFLAVLSLQRAPLWGDNLSLMRQAVEREPDGVLPHIFYGKELEWQAREIERAAVIYPPESRAFRRSAAEHFEEGLRQSDAYVFDPFPSVILLARNWALSGKHREAIELLERSMPDPTKCNVISKYGLRLIIVPEDRFGFPYSVELLTLAEGHYWLGEAYLAWASEAPRDQSLRMLDRVCLEARQALRMNPAFYEAYALLAKEFLFHEALSEDASQAALAVGGGRLAVATPQLDKMGRVNEILQTFSPPIPVERIPALACLSMACAARDAAEYAGASNRTAQLLDSLAWARRASDYERAFGESFWVQADTLHQLLKSLPDGQPKEAARVKSAFLKALKSIGPNSPRHTEAQRLLESLKVDATP
jgi:hypothetical protein